MAGKSPSSLNLVLTDDDGLGSISVDMEAFFEFSFWLAEELEDLVALWAHASTPRSLRAEFGSSSGR